MKQAIAKITSKKAMTATLAAIISVALLAGSLAGTLANSNDYSVDFANPYPKQNRTIEIGKTAPIEISNAAKWDNSDDSVLRLTVGDDGNKATVEGLKCGAANISIGSYNGNLIVNRYKVVNSSGAEGYTIKDGLTGKIEKKGGTLAVPITLRPATAVDSINWMSLHPGVATVTQAGGVITATADQGTAVIIGAITDKWGVERSISYVVTVGGNGNGGAGQQIDKELEDALKKAEEVLTDGTSKYPGKTDELKDLEDARDKGVDVKGDKDATNEEKQNVIDEINKAIDEVTGNNGGNGGDGDGNGNGSKDPVQGPDGNWYQPVGTPENVYEVTDENGNSKTQPPTYVWDKDGDPSNGIDGGDAYPDGNGGFYVEDPDGSNIFKKVDDNGGLKDSPAIWGGPDKALGGGDDKDALLNVEDGGYYVEDPAGSNIYKKVDENGDMQDCPAIWGGADKQLGTPDDKTAEIYDGSYYVNLGQNVFQKVNGAVKLGEMAGGGLDRDPSTDPATPIFEDSNGKYYVGPMGPDSKGNKYYFGDPATGGNGLLDSDFDLTPKGDDIKWFRDSNGNMTTRDPKAPGVIPGGNGDSNHYVPVGKPDTVFEVVNPDGTSKTQPPSYVYDKDKDPTNGIDGGPAYPDKGGFYVEDPAGSNIYKKVEDNGSLTDSPAIWGGPDRKVGGGDDQIAEEHDGDYYVSLGQNVFQKVEAPTQLGKLIGGGPDQNPATDPVGLIFDYTARDGKYYVGPLTDAKGDEYYYGDKKVDGNGLLESTAQSREGDDVKWYMYSSGDMSIAAPPKDGKPTIAWDRTLSKNQSGDTTEWVEIAKNGGYSLIVRKNVVRSGEVFDPAGNNSYETSNARNRVTSWYRDFSANSPRLKKFAVRSNATERLGNQKYDDLGGFSVPKPEASTGDYVFLLSTQEVAAFCSMSHYDYGHNLKSYDLNKPYDKNDHNLAACHNWTRLLDGISTNWWLRTPMTEYTASKNVGRVDVEGRANGSVWNGVPVSGQNDIRPAMWVYSEIFD